MTVKQGALATGGIGIGYPIFIHIAPLGLFVVRVRRFYIHVAPLGLVVVGLGGSTYMSPRWGLFIRNGIIQIAPTGELNVKGNRAPKQV